jgi:hypothetical protein
LKLFDVLIWEKKAIMALFLVEAKYHTLMEGTKEVV